MEQNLINTHYQSFLIADHKGCKKPGENPVTTQQVFEKKLSQEEKLKNFGDHLECTKTFYEPEDANFTPVSKQPDVPPETDRFIIRRKLIDNLSEAGIYWSSEPDYFLTPTGEDIELMKTLKNTASKIPPDRRPEHLWINISNEGADRGILGGFCGGGITISSVGPNGERQSAEQLKDTLLHEYGHAVAYADKSQEGSSVKDSHGNKIFDRAVAIEEQMKQQGFRQDNISDNTDNRFDPYVESFPLYDTKGKPAGKKYAGVSADEHYAESFDEYVNHPNRFKEKIQNQEKQLKSLKPGSPEYNYVKESLDIMQETYNYFKEAVFNGYEFLRNG